MYVYGIYECCLFYTYICTMYLYMYVYGRHYMDNRRVATPGFLVTVTTNTNTDTDTSIN